MQPLVPLVFHNLPSLYPPSFRRKDFYTCRYIHIEKIRALHTTRSARSLRSLANMIEPQMEYEEPQMEYEEPQMEYEEPQMGMVEPQMGMVEPQMGMVYRDAT